MLKTEERSAVEFELNGQKIFGIFHKPLKTVDKVPAVLICHGLAGQKVGRYRVYVELAEALCRQGIAVLRFDFRGSGDSEGSFTEMTLTSELQDAHLVLNWLSNHPEVDADRIGLFGRSMGGSIALLTAAEFKKCKSLVLWAPIFSAKQWEEPWVRVQNNEDPPELLEFFRTINGQLGGLPFYKEFFAMDLRLAMKNVENIPFLHIHGLKDLTVYPDHAASFKQERKGSEAESRFLLLPESDHDFSYISEKKQALQETCQWFKKTL